MDDYHHIPLAMGGRQIFYNDHPSLFAIVEDVAKKSGVKRLPALYRIPESFPNAFTTGFNQNDSLIALNDGILEHFDKEEIKAIIAHEFGHIIEDDIQKRTEVALKAISIERAGNLISYGVLVGHDIFLPDSFGGDGDGGFGAGGAIVIAAVVAIKVISKAMAREQIKQALFASEHNADIFSSKITSPHFMALALSKMEKLSNKINKKNRKIPSTITSLFLFDDIHPETHPPTKDRIEMIKGTFQVGSFQERKKQADYSYCINCGGEMTSNDFYCCNCGNPQI